MRLKEYRANAIHKRIEKDLTEHSYILLGIVGYMIVAQIIFKTVCPFKIMTGINCPGCGLTHACVSIATFRIAEAAKYNVSAFLWLPYIGYLLFYRYLIGKKAPFTIPFVVICCICSIAQWIYKALLYLHVIK